MIVGSANLQRTLLSVVVATAASVGFAFLAYVAARYVGMLGIVALAGVAVVALISALHPFVPFAVYFGLLFFADTRLPGLPMSLNQIIGPLFLLSATAYWARGQMMRLQSKVLPWLLLMSAYFLINAVTGESMENGFIQGRYVVIYCLYAVALAAAMKSERAILAYAWIITTLSFVAALAGIVEAIQKGTFFALAGKITDAVRVRGAASTAVVYGWNLLFAFPFAFFLFAEVRSRLWRGIALLMACTILFVALLSLSRTIIALAFIQTIVCARVFRYPNRRRVLAVLGVLVIVAAALVMPVAIKRFVGVADYRRDYSLMERRDNAIISREVFKAHPIFGVGLGSYSVVWRNYIPSDYRTFFAQYIEASRPRYTDQGYMQILCEGGIVGFGLFAALVVVIFRQAFRIRRRARECDDSFAWNLAALVIAGLNHLLLSTLTDDTFLYVRVWLLYAVALLLDERLLWPRTDTEAVPGTTPPEPAGSS
ncbi:MAG: O-antigen ligase family protein [Candidatus Sumerlaea chitinivorans]|nr:O-antigen ligase family protein [Candidatus Sumerlaea chitinivorans]